MRSQEPTRVAPVLVGDTTLRTVIAQPRATMSDCPTVGKCNCRCGECWGNQAHVHCSGGGHGSGCHMFCG
jgi:hypothetical protein